MWNCGLTNNTYTMSKTIHTQRRLRRNSSVFTTKYSVEFLQPETARAVLQPGSSEVDSVLSRLILGSHRDTRHTVWHQSGMPKGLKYPQCPATHVSSWTDEVACLFQIKKVPKGSGFTQETGVSIHLKTKPLTSSPKPDHVVSCFSKTHGVHSHSDYILITFTHVKMYAHLLPLKISQTQPSGADDVIWNQGPHLPQGSAVDPGDLTELNVSERLPPERTSARYQRHEISETVAGGRF